MQEKSVALPRRTRKARGDGSQPPAAAGVPAPDDDTQEQAEPADERWGDHPSKEQKASLEGMLRRWEGESDHGECVGPFAGERLSGSEVFWLAVRAVASPDGDMAQAEQDLRYPPAYMRISALHLEGADLGMAQLEGANLRNAHLQRADLSEAHLEGADLIVAQLEGADLSWARLERAILSEAQLEGAFLMGASFDKNSYLYGAHLNKVVLDQARFDNTNLTVVKWREVTRLGDELKADTADWNEKPEQYRVAARTYRALSVALQDQGIKDAGRFRYRSEVMERKAYWWDMLTSLRSRMLPGVFPGKGYTAFLPALGRWLEFKVLDLLTGYGNFIGRLLCTYAYSICLFAYIYFQLAQQSLTPEHVLNMRALSAMAFHGRGVLAGQLSSDLPPLDARHLEWLNWVGASESVTGLLIEGLLVALLLRRVTGG